MASTYALMNVAASLPKGCLDKFAPSKEQWRCMYFSRACAARLSVDDHLSISQAAAQQALFKTDPY